MKKFTSRSAQRGLTLIELVVVMAILIALAGLVLPRLDFLKGQASLASSAANAGELSTMIQTYKSSNSTGSYPALDSLISGTGVYTSTFTVPGQTAAPLLSAATLSGAPSGTANYRSLLEGGLRYTLPIKSTVTDASDAFDGTATLTDMYTAASQGSITVATITQTNGAPYNGEIYKACFPGTTVTNNNDGSVSVTLPSSATGTTLVALGIGPNNGMVGSVMSSAPLDQQTGDATTSVYSRYIAVFAVYSSGKPARLLLVTDHRGKPVGTLTSQFNSSGA